MKFHTQSLDITAGICQGEYHMINISSMSSKKQQLMDIGIIQNTGIIS